jgi:hypothetical protein
VGSGPEHLTIFIVTGTVLVGRALEDVVIFTVTDTILLGSGLDLCRIYRKQLATLRYFS